MLKELGFKGIIYNENLNKNFHDYGILIPIAESRSSRVFQELNKKFSHFYESDLSCVKLERKDLERVHTKMYVENLYGKNLEAELLKVFELIDENGRPNRYDPGSAKFPLSEIFANILGQSAGTYLNLKNALTNNFSYFLGGGMHHAMSFGGAGFCTINDGAIAIRKLQAEGLIKTAWIIDVDAHKGDGTAEIFQNDKSVTTFSIHMQNDWPLSGKKFDEKGSLNPSFIPSNIDVEVNKNNQSDYIQLLEKGLALLAKQFTSPDICLVVNGADPYIKDELESTKNLAVSKEGMLERDKLVFNFLKDRNIPQAYVMAGGYGKYSWEIYYQFLNYALENFVR